MPDKRIEKFLIASAQVAKTGKGKAYLRLRMYANGGKQWNAIFWEDREPPKSGTVVDCSVEESEFNGEPQLTVHAMRELPNEVPDGFLPKTPFSIDGLYDELQGFVKGIINPALRRLLERATADPLWKRTPAATQIHHAYVGGLLEHTVNLCRLANALLALYPRLNHDLMLCGAILHDIGKIHEIEIAIVPEYSVRGQLIGHVGLGLERITAIMNEDREAFGTYEQPTELRFLVQHIVASHHGNPQYGALKPPATLEAQVFCDLDGLDAHIGSIVAAIDATPPNQQFTAKVRWDTRYYIGGAK